MSSPKGHDPVLNTYIYVYISKQRKKVSADENKNAILLFLFPLLFIYILLHSSFVLSCYKYLSFRSASVFRAILQKVGYFIRVPYLFPNRCIRTVQKMEKDRKAQTILCSCLVLVLVLFGSVLDS